MSLLSIFWFLYCQLALYISNMSWGILNIVSDFSRILRLIILIYFKSETLFVYFRCFTNLRQIQTLNKHKINKSHH